MVTYNTVYTSELDDIAVEGVKGGIAVPSC